SNAYATQEILLVLSMGGAALFARYAPWVALGVVIIYFVVVASYRQNVHAYPSGGGDYEVVTTNLGERAGLVVAGALLVDYVMTVAVSIASAVQNIASTTPSVNRHLVLMSVLLIVGITLMNLRGVRESGTAFAIPTYAFIVAIFAMVIYAAIRLSGGAELRAESADWVVRPEAAFSGLALVFLMARAFSSGTTALTGVEAISNGVPAFKPPKSRNAATTLALLGLISMSMFSAITWLALRTGVKVTEFDKDLVGLPPGQAQKTVIVQIAEAVFGEFRPGVLVVSLVTALILVLAANTAFNGFPVLGSILARDGYLPRQLHTRGDRLAFSNGILLLAGVAIALIYAFDASVSRLIQLYIVGVFISFTLSQLGMIRHWTSLLRAGNAPGERAAMLRSRVINAIGFVLCGAVLIIVLLTKFTRGAWLVCLAIPLLYLLMRGIRRHYDRVATEIAPLPGESVALPPRVFAVVLVSKLHRPTLRAIAYARATRPSSLEAITVSVDPEETLKLSTEWEERAIPVPLKVLDSPYREITRPVVDYIRGLQRQSPRDVVIVYVPEYVVGHWWEQILHNQSALRLKARLLFTPGVMMVSVPWQLLSSQVRAERPETEAPGAVRRGQPAPAVAEQLVAREISETTYE
ncbi:MAG TPA: DNA-binding protein, partial [Actinobacteria bacterium]|nr:DNA-binding protein [Actinomycetota bacterium]